MTGPAARREAARDSRPWLLWDGACGFCCWAVAWARARGADARFRIAAYQDAPSPPMDDALRRQARRAVQVLHPDGRRLEGGRAVLAVLEGTGFRTAAQVLRRPPLVWGVNAAYAIVARRRSWFARFASRDPRTCR